MTHQGGGSELRAQRAPKVVFIGLDGADGELALAWAEQGELPALRQLRERAVWGETENPDGYYVGGVWPSFSTATSPARHGQYCWKQFDPASYLDLDPPYDDGDGEPFWRALDRAGREVALIDVPRTVLIPDFGGVQVHDWGTHDALAPGFCTSPPELAEEILERYGVDPVGVCNRAPRSELRHYRELLARLKRRITVKRELARDLMTRWAWDLFAVGFGDAHCVAHQCWHLHDASHPRHDAELARALGDPLLVVYRALDEALAELIGALGPDTRLVVLFSHGVGPHYDGDHLLDEALRRIEKKLPIGRGPTLAERLSRLAHSRDRARPPLFGLFRRWPERAFRKAFRVPNNEAFAGIRLNVFAREPLGRIRMGEEYDACCELLSRELMLLRNGATGGPAFARVERSDDLYRGPKLELLPDLVAQWTRDAEFTALESPTIGRVEGRSRGVRSGDHRPQGLFLATGPGLTPDRVSAPVSVMDFGPTIAELLGVELGDVDGRPIPALLSAVPAARRLG
jgi:predicted AlkP superfamily phosphohydrolase/phosphomutase